MTTPIPPGHDEADVVIRIQLCLGCAYDLVGPVLERMVRDPLWSLSADPDTFEHLAWKCFGEERKARLRARGDDPLLDIRVSAPPGAEGGGP